MCDGHLWLALSVLTGHFPRVTPSSLTSPAPDGADTFLPPPVPRAPMSVSGPHHVSQAPTDNIGAGCHQGPGPANIHQPLMSHTKGRCISGASSHRDNIHWPREPSLWMELLINTTGVQRPALGGVTTVAVGLICFNLLLDVQYISQTAGGRRTGGRGSQT